MFNTKNILQQFVFVFLFVLFSLYSNAYAACTTRGYPEYMQYRNTVAIQGGVINISDDTPVGSVIKRQRIIGLRDVRANCGSPITIKGYLVGGNLYSGQTNVYQTGLSGLGVRFKGVASGSYFPFSYPRIDGNSGHIFTRDGDLAYDIEFVKMGALTPGTINTSSFPMLVVDATDNSAGPAWAMRGFYSGSFTIKSPTCTTPDNTYDLGTYSEISFPTRGGKSAWISTPIVLTGCSNFAGNNTNDSFTQYTMTGTNTGTVIESGNRVPVNISVKLTPVTSIIDNNNGVISLNNTSSATGFGIQLGFKQGAGDFIPQNLSNEFIAPPRW